MEAGRDAVGGIVAFIAAALSVAARIAAATSADAFATSADAFGIGAAFVEGSGRVLGAFADALVAVLAAFGYSKWMPGAALALSFGVVGCGLCISGHDNISSATLPTGMGGVADAGGERRRHCSGTSLMTATADLEPKPCTGRSGRNAGVVARSAASSMVSDGPSDELPGFLLLPAPGKAEIIIPGWYEIFGTV